MVLRMARGLLGCDFVAARGISRSRQIPPSGPRSVDRYLIESPHTVGDCRMIVKDVYAQGYLHNVEWGCKAGVHKAWVIIEADNEGMALRVVPPVLRAQATAVRLVKFDRATVESWPESRPPGSTASEK